MADHMLTTVDNPFNPWTDFDEWNAFDLRAGYNTMAFLARVTVLSHELSETQQEDALEDAIREIAEHNVLGIYRLVPDPDAPASSDVELTASV